MHEEILFHRTGDKNPNAQGYGSSGPHGNTLRTAEIVADGYGTPRIANETRPQNLGVNIFIKINNSCN